MGGRCMKAKGAGRKAVESRSRSGSCIGKGHKLCRTLVRKRLARFCFVCSAADGPLHSSCRRHQNLTVAYSTHLQRLHALRRLAAKYGQNVVPATRRKTGGLNQVAAAGKCLPSVWPHLQTAVRSPRTGAIAGMWCQSTAQMPVKPAACSLA